MPAPQPLTLCDPAKIDWSRPGTPMAEEFDDIYFSIEGGLAETETVFLNGCGLPDRWLGRKTFAIGELGFGTGLNFLASWRLWDAHKPPGGHLHFISVEKYPLDREQLTQALSEFPDLDDKAAKLIALWPGRVKGFHRCHPSPDITLTLIHDDVMEGLTNLEARIDAWFLDGFSPAKDPHMWSSDVMSQVARLSSPSARLATFTVAGSVRQALQDVGFEVEKKEGFGRKRHRLEGIFKGGEEQSLPSDIRPVIIGAGIAGASVAYSFMRRGIVPIIIDTGDNSAASGNPAAIVKPRLDLQDRPESRFFLSSFLYAKAQYEAVDGVVSHGVFHICTTNKDLERFEKLTEIQPLPPHEMRWASTPDGLQGLEFPGAQIIDPVKVCKTLCEGAEIHQGLATDWVREPNGHWRVSLGDHHITGTHVILTMGAGIREISAFDPLGLRYSRGQISWGEAELDQTLTYGGYAIPLNNGTLLGATHQRLDDQNPYDLRDEDDVTNQQNFEQATGLKIARSSVRPSRASVRVNTPRTLPLVTQSDERLWLMTGLGSRGFVFAPLLSEDLVSQICADPSALALNARVRFQARESPT